MRTTTIKTLPTLFLTAVFCLLLGATRALGVPVPGIDVTYTSDADFDQGTLMNLNHEAVHDQLQLSDTVTPFPFINIANSGRGTIVRIDVNTGAILGEYYTSPSGRGRNPSRTTVDQFGNVWVSNRDESGSSGGKRKGSITRVGLIIGGTRVNADGSPNPTGQYLQPPFQYNTCIDRSGDGLIKTSRAAGNMLSWSNAGGADTHGGVSTAEDECIINYTRVIATNTRTVAIDANNDIWVGGANTAHEKVDGVSGQPVPGTQFNLGCGGYGGLIDKNGVLWSARFGSGLLRYDTNTMTGKCLGTGKGDYGLGMDPNTGEIWHTYLTGGYVCKIAPDGSLLGKYYHGNYYAQGVVVDKSGNVWVAHSLYRSSVGHLRTDGTLVGTISTGSGPTGVAVDANGKVWSTNYYGWSTSRIAPDAGPVGDGGFKKGAVDLTVSLGSSAYPYNYSDMTGYVAIGGTSHQGSWTVVQDSGIAGNTWGTITWNKEPQGSTPSGSIILVEARAAETDAGLSGKSFLSVSNNEPFSLTGRYLEVRVTLKPSGSGDKPVLSDLRISVTPITDVRVIDTIASGDVVINENSFSYQPYSITYDSGTAVIEWRFDTFTIGRIQDLSYTVIMKNPVPGEDRVVNHKLEVLYTDINGNSVRNEVGPHSVHVLGSKYASSLATDKQSYAAKENVLISSGITNLSLFATTVDAKVAIEDGSGAVMEEVAVLTGLQFGPGETKNFNDLVFNTGTNYPGGYRARLTVYEGQSKVGETSSEFTILPDIAVGAAIATDKMSYKSNEQVVVTSAVQSLSTNTMIENLTARITIRNSQGAVLLTDSRPVALLVPGQRITLTSFWNTAVNPAGTYTAALEVLSGETVLSTSSAQFEILASSSSGAGLSGTISVSPAWVYQGGTETFTTSITNSGNEDLANLAASIIIADPDTGEAKIIIGLDSVTVGRGQTATDARDGSTQTLAPKVYLAILTVQSASMTEARTLASANFEVKAGIEVTKTTPDLKHVLVWLNYPWESGQNCPDRAAIEAALDEAGVEYTIVLGKKDFQSELRNPIYTDLLILGDHNPIEDHFAEELREQVYAGKGLISSLFDRQSLNEQVFGITFRGGLSGRDYAVEIGEPSLGIQGTFQSQERAARIEAADSGDVIGLIKDSSGKEPVQRPAIVKHHYGEGKVLFFAFDLGMSSGTLGFEALLGQSLNFIHRPLNPAAFLPNQLVPIEITVKSLGGTVGVKITETYPEGVEIYDPENSTWVADNPRIWTIELASGETETILYYARMPDEAGSYSFQTEAGYLENGTYVPYQTLATEITVARSTAGVLTDVLSGLQTLNLKGQEAAARDNAVRYLNNVLTRAALTESDRQAIIADLCKALNNLFLITSVDVTNTRQGIDSLLLFWEAEWYSFSYPL